MAQIAILIDAGESQPQAELDRKVLDKAGAIEAMQGLINLLKESQAGTQEQITMEVTTASADLSVDVSVSTDERQRTFTK